MSDKLIANMQICQWHNWSHETSSWLTYKCFYLMTWHQLSSVLTQKPVSSTVSVMPVPGTKNMCCCCRIWDDTAGQNRSGLGKRVQVVPDQSQHGEKAGNGADEQTSVHQPEVLHIPELLQHHLRRAQRQNRSLQINWTHRERPFTIEPDLLGSIIQGVLDSSSVPFIDLHWFLIDSPLKHKVFTIFFLFFEQRFKCDLIETVVPRADMQQYKYCSTTSTESKQRVSF